jgi:hypothetical protein
VLFIFLLSNIMEEKEKYYLGNSKLPTRETKHEYTPDMINELKKCRKNILHFAENYFYIVNLDRGKEKIMLHPCQKRVLRSLRDNRFIILLSSRQAGKTTMMTIYSLWVACFSEDQRLLIVANKEQTAKNIFKRIRTAYEMLPNYLKPGVVEYGQTSMTLTNGSSIGISTTSSDAGRGESVNVTVLDELAFIDNHIVEKFWESVYPIISSSKKSKIFIASTPNGTENLFYRLFQGAVDGSNNWKAERIDWWEIPGRDEKWKNETIKTLGSTEAFAQEFGNEFIASGETSLNEDHYNELLKAVKDPEYVFDDGHYKLWEEPKNERVYVAGVDVSEGIGEAASVIQILDMTDLSNIEQVAVYHNKNIIPYQFTAKLLEILVQWGNPPVLIERNNCGAQVVEQLKFTHGYENIVTWGAKAAHIVEKKRFGILAHTNTKYRGITNMRYWTNEIKVVRIRDINTLRELKNFVRFSNNTWGARPGTDSWDDRVMALIWTLIILENEICVKYFDVEKLDEYNRPQIIKPLEYNLSKVISPVGSYLNEKDPTPGGLPVVFNNKTIDDIDTTPLTQDVVDLANMGYVPFNPYK